MAPTGTVSPDDLDSANTGVKELKREKSINNAAVFRVAKCVATATKENDDSFLREAANYQQKLDVEPVEDAKPVLDDGKLAFIKNFIEEVGLFSLECSNMF